MDYRGISAFLREFSEAREVIELLDAPHFTTLQKACQRLLKRREAMRLLEGTLEAYYFKKTGSASSSGEQRLTALASKAGT